MTEPVDNLPLDGEVYVEGDVRVYIYRGYHCQNFDQCAVGVKGETDNKWVERKKLKPVQTKAEQTQSCARGEHMYVTGRRTCPLCGEAL